MSDNVTVKKSVTVTAQGIDAGDIMADLSSSDIIILSVYDGHESRDVSIDREVFKEFVNAIEEIK